MTCIILYTTPHSPIVISITMNTHKQSMIEDRNWPLDLYLLKIKMNITDTLYVHFVL